jgi:glutathione S-transferase
MVFAEAGVPYEDIRIESDSWPSLKSSGKPPFGQLPILQVGNRTFGQSMAIARFIAKRFNLMGSNDMDAFFIDSINEEVYDILGKFYEHHRSPNDDKKSERATELISKFLPPKLENLSRILEHDDDGQSLPKPRQYFLGDQISLADIALFHAFDHTLLRTMAPQALDSVPSVKAVFERVSQRPGIAHWVAHRPKTEW